MLPDHMVYKIWPEKSHHIAMVTEISLLTALCSLIMWHVNLGLGYISKCTSHFRLFPELPSCVIWSCAVSFCVASRFLLHFTQQAPPSSPSHHLLSASWHMILYILVVSNGGYWLQDDTLPPERTQPQKLCTANFSSGTLKTLINRLLRLKNKIFWRAPCEKKPFFSRLKSDSQKYILKWSYWPEILAPGLKSIFVTTLFSNFFHFTQPLPSWQLPLKWGKGGIFALLA